MWLLPVIHKESWLVVVTTSALVIYGVLQERVMTKGWGAQQELFPYSSFLVLSNRLFCVIVLIAHSLYTGQSFTPVAPLRSYCLVSASNMLSTMCQYEALKYVSFVAQTLAKTAKALPVVLWGTLVGGKRYSARQYIHAILVTGGCSMFVLGGDITSGSATRDPSWRSYAAGGGLLLTFLAADGWTSTQQEVLFRTHDTPVREQLLYTTAFSTMYSLAATLAGGHFMHALSFLQRHPDAAMAVLTLSLASTAIQVCISSVLQCHGALMFALIMTSRQCVSVLLSTVLFGHGLSMSQWVGIAAAFSALYHQKASSSSNKGGATLIPPGRSRLAISSGPKHHLVQDSKVVQPVQDPATQGLVAPVASQAKLAFRGSLPSRAIVPHTALSIQASAGAEVAGVHPASGLAVSIVPAGARGLAVPGHDAHLVAVADVHPAAPAACIGSSGQYMIHRHTAHPAGMALSLPTVSQQHAVTVDPSAGDLRGVQAAMHNSTHVHHTERAAPPVKNLATLWLKGTGRRRVDPTTAVAMDHRQS